ncbi:DUF1697 domain-containing protein [uncultured Dokdonia sp.]|uniref:DUF1697 domain-containing protein n=1 Tax=uncultured Dokdonia sp. TaxID=575653 RepID=UPI00262F7C46|nr:DUF1697 domain-containing protein [uncultured Dokdonia sp.]
MNTYICLLRGINVGGHKKIKMADLKTLFTSLGYNDVVTYIQSGNIIFKSHETSIDEMTAVINKAIVSTYGFEVPVFVLTRTMLIQVYENYVLSPECIASSYFTLLHTVPSTKDIALVNNLELPNEHFVVTENCVYIYPEKGYGKAKATNTFFEKKLNVVATTRNYKTIVKLLELSS